MDFASIKDSGLKPPVYSTTRFPRPHQFIEGQIRESPTKSDVSRLAVISWRSLSGDKIIPKRGPLHRGTPDVTAPLDGRPVSPPPGIKYITLTGSLIGPAKKVKGDT